MRILLIGNGGREHALAWKIKQSPLLTALYHAPASDAITEIAEVAPIDIRNHAQVCAWAKAEAIDLVMVGPEEPLVNGLADALQQADIACFGPTAAAARMEGSKAFTKDICDARNIRTAAYAVFTEAAPAAAYIQQQGAPIVVKADGLAAGKGVTVAMTEAEAIAAVTDALGGRFGQAGATVVIEEYLKGEEVSFFALTNGKQAFALASAQDHKAVGDGDTGPNTGGMGTYSPAPILLPHCNNKPCRR